MSKVSLRHIKDYFLLLIVSGAAIVLSLLAEGNKSDIRNIVLGLSIVYILWGLFHHKNEGTLKKEIIFEYVLISALGSALVIGLL